MEKLFEVLENFDASINWKTEEGFVTDGTLDSIEIVELVSQLEDAFDIVITMDEMEPENFDSAKAMWDMIQELQD